MNKKELDNLISQISHREDGISDNFYEAYGIVDKMHYSKDQLKSSIDVLWDICMKASEKERKEKYMFEEGLIVAKDSFIQAKKDEGSFDEQERIAFQKAEVAFHRKLENIKPAVEFLIRMKEIV